MKKQKTSTVSDILVALVLMLFILSAAVVFTLNFRPLYRWDITLQNLPETTGLSESEIAQNYDALIDYNSMFTTGELTLPSFSMSESGRIHFQEVKNIFVAIQLLFIGTLIAGVIGVWIKLKRESAAFLRIGGILTLSLPAVLGVLVAVSWERVFVTFHTLFFNNDYWIFSAETDPVITILPNAFFMHCAILILFLVLLGGVAQLLIYHRANKHNRRKWKSKYTLNLK